MMFLAKLPIAIDDRGFPSSHIVQAASAIDIAIRPIGLLIEIGDFIILNNYINDAEVLSSLSNS